MDFIPHFYRPNIQESISIKGSCGSYRLGQFQQVLKNQKASKKPVKPLVKQDRKTFDSFRLPVYTETIYYPDNTTTSKFKASPFISISPIYNKPSKRVPLNSFTPLQSENAQNQPVSLYYIGELKKSKFQRKKPFQPPKQMFLGPAK